MQHDRRRFIKDMTMLGGAVLLLPSMTACTDSNDTTKTENGEKAAAGDPLAIPQSQPADWDAIAFNKERALAGAAPASYHGAISSEDGDTKHVGKHLPYLPGFEATPDGYVAVMFGDERKGYPRHPNSEPIPDINDEGHWYDWIRISKAGSDSEITSTYSSWPETAEDDKGRYAVFSGDDIKAGKGRETVYLAALPDGVKKGDTIRIVGHCNKHGEWVDFFTLSIR